MNELEKELKGRTISYISAALGLVAGLAWNEAISTSIDSIFPLSKDTILIKFLYAGLVTIAVVVIIKYLDKIINTPGKK
jgi:hypothetical protein